MSCCCIIKYWIFTLQQCLSALQERRVSARNRLAENFRKIQINDVDEDDKVIREVMQQVYESNQQMKERFEESMNSNELIEFMEQVRQDLLHEGLLSVIDFFNLITYLFALLRFQSTPKLS